ncbi:IclR family transcriptional regulator [Pseudomonas sp. TE21394]
MKKRDAEDLNHDPDLDRSDDRQFLVALARGLNILKVLGKNHQASLGNAELAHLTGLSKATVSRITYTLSSLGYVDYIEQLGRYRIGAGGIALGYSSLSGSVVQHVARPLMRELAEYSGLAVAVGTRTGLNMVYLGSERSSDLLSMRLSEGSIIPIESTAIGHAYLAGIEAGPREELLAALRADFPERMQASDQQLEQNLELCSSRGYSIVTGLWHPHVNAVGVPFTPADGTSTLAFTCGGLSYYASEQRLHEEIAPRLVELVKRVELILQGDAGLARQYQA